MFLQIRSHQEKNTGYICFAKAGATLEAEPHKLYVSDYFLAFSEKRLLDSIVLLKGTFLSDFGVVHS